MPGLRVRLTPEAAPARLDQALVEALAQQHGVECTRSQVLRAFGAGGVVVVAGGRALKPSLRVEHALEVEVTLAPPPPLRAEPEALPISVLYEDDDVLVVDKAAGMVVHAGPGHPRGTLVNAVLHHLGLDAEGLPVLPGNDATRPGIVHRLDRDTSGVLVVAKHAVAQERLAAQFRTHDLRRRYLGVVEGVVPWDCQRLDTGHARDPRERRRFAPIEGATRRAVTELEVVQRLHGATLLAFTLHTGRTHQIRMHARHLGHPILGDALYGRPPRDPAVRAAVGVLRRHALHAQVLELRHPGTGTLVRWEAGLPDDLQALLRRLGG
ncbi:MAG: RluA family pseudouridine synthase [Nannocystaceae bacterium]